MTNRLRREQQLVQLGDGSGAGGAEFVDDRRRSGVCHLHRFGEACPGGQRRCKIRRNGVAGPDHIDFPSERERRHVRYLSVRTVANNPAFGLNALGGAINISTAKQSWQRSF